MKANKLTKNKLPIGVLILAIIYYFATIVYIATAIVLFLKSEWFRNVPPFNNNPILTPQTFYILGGVLLLMSIVSVTIATGLIMRKNWARYLAIVLSAIFVAGGILSILEKSYISIINLVVNLLIIIYLVFSKKVKEKFDKPSLKKLIDQD